jgi:glutamate racemase
VVSVMQPACRQTYAGTKSLVILVLTPPGTVKNRVAE